MQKKQIQPKRTKSLQKDLKGTKCSEKSQKDEHRYTSNLQGTKENQNYQKEIQLVI